MASAQQSEKSNIMEIKTKMAVVAITYKTVLDHINKKP